MVKLTIGKQITISGLPVKFHKSIKDYLTLSNPTFHVMKAMKKSTYKTLEYFKYYKVQGEDLIVPRGLLEKIKKYVLKCGVAYTLEWQLVDKQVDSFVSDIKLRDYQKTLIDNLISKDYRQGIISMTTGSGKTIVALEIIKELSLSATILVPNNVILEQFVNECKSKFGYDPGVINGLEKSIKDITIATFQSLQRNKALLKELSDNTSILIIDECQGTPADGRVKVLEEFAPQYLFGLSGTPDRTDGRAKAIFFYLGDIIAEYQGELLSPTVEVIFTKEKIPLYSDYHKIIDKMIENKSRNKLIAGLTIGEMTQGRRVLTLTKRVQHYKNIEPMVGNFAGVHFIDSQDPSRNDLLTGLKEFGDFRAIFGTTSLLAVGTDIPALDTLIIACDIKSSVLTTQSIGRILRLFEGKQHPKIIDLCDNENPILFRQYRERERLYIKKGWKVITPWETFN